MTGRNQSHNKDVGPDGGPCPEAGGGCAALIPTLTLMLKLRAFAFELLNHRATARGRRTRERDLERDLA